MIEPLLGEDGYLHDYTQWTPEIALQIAKLEHIELQDKQHFLIQAIRDFYQIFELSPTMAVFLNYTQKQNQAYAHYSSLELMNDFPGRGSPMKRLCKIAGLPKPTNCF